MFWFRKSEETLTKQQVELITKVIEGTIEKKMQEIQVAQNRKFEDLEGRIIDFTAAARGKSASGYRSGEPRYGYPGRALQEREEDKEELGLFF